jgi:hypothetical protein
MVLDSHGNIWAVGAAGSNDFPITDSNIQPGSGIFVAELSSDGGELLYSSWLRGPRFLHLFGDGLLIDSHDDLYLAGSYALKFSSTRHTVLYNTSALPWPANSPKYAIRALVDENGILYVAGDGLTSPTPGVFSYEPDQFGIYLIAVDPTGAQFLFSTQFGYVNLLSITRDREGNFYLAGLGGSDFPSTNDAIQRTPGPGFLLKLSPDASQLLYSTFLGQGTHGVPNGGGGFQPLQIKLGPDGKLYMLGQSYQDDIPLTSDAYQPCYPQLLGSLNIWTYIRFAPDLRSIEYATVDPQAMFYDNYKPALFTCEP